jgi:putative drug exporter of the RND superfamily
VIKVTTTRRRFASPMARKTYGMALGRWLGRVARTATEHPKWVLGGWVLIAVALNLTGPALEKVVQKDATPFLPSNSPSIRAFDHMDGAFAGGKGKSIAFVVLTGPGFAQNPADQAYYRRLVRALGSNDAHVADLQDYASRPDLQQALTSKDGDATYVPVSLRHPVGSPKADEDVSWVRLAVRHDRPPDLHAYVTGDVASIADLNSEINKSIARITFVTVAIIIVIVLLLYRSLILPLVPLATIGVALLAARGLVSIFGRSFLPVSTYTGAFLTALVLGAGTDYTIFLISRFHEAMREGEHAGDAVVTSVRRIGPVVVASGFTVIIGSAAMVLTKLALFHTSGPAIAVAVFVTLLVGLTFTPAMLGLLGDRVAPPELRGKRRRTGSDTRWASVGSVVARRPLPVAVVTILLLALLAAFWPRLHPSYDTRALVPAAVESSKGYDALDQHFPKSEVSPDYVVVSDGHDVSTPAGLAVIEQAAATIERLPGISAVRGITRPSGTPIPQAELSNQLANVGDKLGTAGNQLTGSTAGVSRLAGGANRLAAGSHQLSHGTNQATDAVGAFLAGLAQEDGGLRAAARGTGAARRGAGALADGAHQLADALSSAHRQTATAVHGLGAIYAALSHDNICTADPICATSRAGLRRIWVGERDRLLPGLAQAANAARRIGDGDAQLANGLRHLQGGMQKAADGIRQLAAGERTFRRKLGRLAGGAATLANGADRLPPGVHDLTQASQQLAHGLAKASSYLEGTAQSTRAAGISAFYLPPGALNNPKLADARAYYLSPNGRTTRLMVYSDDGTSHIDDERAAMQLALRHTPMSGANVEVTGPTAVSDDIHHFADADLRLVAFVTLAAVLLILIALLRAIVAPLYLLASVLLSYGAAMGLSALFWQDLLGKPSDFTMPLLAFVILVSVGADYNILLMSRVREESATATRAGVARAVTATGGVITSAGLVFAGTFIAMTSSPVLGLVETGTGVAAGLLIDTFVVRSLLVPSVAALLGPVNWWPGERNRSIAPSLAGLRVLDSDRDKADSPRAAS